MALEESAFAYLFVHAQLLAELGLQAALSELALGEHGSSGQLPGAWDDAQDAHSMVAEGPLIHGHGLDSFDWSALEGTLMGSAAGVDAGLGAVAAADQRAPGSAGNHAEDVSRAGPAPSLQAGAGDPCGKASTEPGLRQPMESQLLESYLAMPELSSRIAQCRSRIPETELMALLAALKPLDAVLTMPTDPDGLAAWLQRYLAPDAQLGALVACIRAADAPP